MKNYIILNNQISTNIQGLLISELPPISKPKIRTQTEEIDGRDGDIVTYLGYSAYDKEFTIGLYDDYNVDEIIAYFNSKGTVTFSNEEDKYYNYEIIEQIDFERLIRYKTATVKMHVQPFKYSVNDNQKIFNIDTNLLNIPTYTKTSNGLTLTVNNGVISISGTGNGTEATEFNVPVSALTLQPDYYTLNAYASGTGVSNDTLRLINTNPTDEDSFGGSAITLENNTTIPVNTTLEDSETYNYVWVSIPAGVAVNFTINLDLKNNDVLNSVSIRNAGNIYSKPIMTLYGAGSIEILLNGQTIFDLDLGSYDFITIDTNLMEAYNGSTLLNRQVTGDYNNFKLNTGINTISWSGDITQIEIDNYSRWI